MLFSLLEALLLIFIQGLAATAICFWVIDTTLLAEITNLAKKWKIGSNRWYPKLDEATPEGMPQYLYTRADWTTWAEVSPFPNLLGHMLNCPKCLSFHASWVTSLILIPFYPAWQLWLAGLAAAPALAMLLTRRPAPPNATASR
jgi:hypothetical protein